MERDLASIEMQVRELFRATLEPLYAFVARRAGSERELVEDVVQETWLREVAAWRRDGTLPREPLAWLQTAARRLLLNHFRTQRRRPTLPLADDVLERIAERSDAAGIAASAAVPWALAQLRDDDATLIEAFHLDGRTTRELALTRGTTERAIEGRLRRARKRMRGVLDRLGADEVPAARSLSTKGETA